VNLKGWLLGLLGDALVVGALLAFVGWLFRKWIATRLTEGIRLETEQKLHEFKARLDAAEAQVSAVRQAGIDATLQLSGIVVAERVVAIKNLWNGVIDWKRATMVSTIVSAMDIEYVRQNGDSARTQATMKQLLDSLKHMELMTATNALQQWRPFVTERAWALFAAYHGFYVARVMRAVSLTLGDTELALRFWHLDNELQIVRAAATPQMTQAYEAGSVATTIPFLNFIEKELLAELQRSLAGEHSGPDASRQAANIVAAVEKTMEDARKAQADRPK